MKLFQYWDTGEPPDDVAECVRTVRDLNPGYDHRLYDRERAKWFIEKHVGARERDVFLSLAIPAMQADYFRLCALWAKGGLWVDADDRCLRPIKTMLRDKPHAYASMRNNRLTNPVLYAREANNPFFGACMELTTRRIEARTPGRATDVTGPLVLNLIWAAADAEGAHEDMHRARDPAFETTPEARAVAAIYPGLAEAVALLERRHQLWTENWLIGVRELNYKATGVDWRKWTGTVYLDGPAAGPAALGERAGGA